MQIRSNREELVDGLQTRPTGRFDFAQDTFAFPNELIYEYQVDPTTGHTRMTRRQPPPTYAHHCFVVVRSVRQFWFHARFEPSQPQPSVEVLSKLVRKVVARSPRQPSPPEHRICIPGFSCLRALSQEQPAVLKANCGGAWQSYALRSHWRMVFPISRGHQVQTAQQLARKIRQGEAPIVHVVRFPQLTINHGLMLFECDEAGEEIRFAAYDPNQPEQPTSLAYHKNERTFYFPANRYWAGGRLDVIEIYRGWFY